MRGSQHGMCPSHHSRRSASARKGARGPLRVPALTPRRVPWAPPGFLPVPPQPGTARGTGPGSVLGLRPAPRGLGAPTGAPPLARPSLRRGRRPEQQAASRRCPAWPAELPSKPLPPGLASARPGGPAPRAPLAGRPPPAPGIRKRALQMLPRRDAGRLVPPPVLPVGASPGAAASGRSPRGRLAGRLPWSLCARSPGLRGRPAEGAGAGAPAGLTRRPDLSGVDGRAAPPRCAPRPGCPRRGRRWSCGCRSWTCTLR